MTEGSKGRSNCDDTSTLDCINRVDAAASRMLHSIRRPAFHETTSYHKGRVDV